MTFCSSYPRPGVDNVCGANAMAVPLMCPNLKCRKILSVPDDVRGKLVKCQQCSTMFRVPENKKPVTDAPQKKAG